MLGLDPNEAIVFRNPGGRVAPDFLRSLAVIATVAAVDDLPTGFELILMQHTDCGLSHLSPHAHADVLSSFFGVEVAEVTALHIGDPYRAVRSDVEQLRSNPMLPRSLVVSGLVYDVDTGLVETVMPPAPLGATPS
ncbi:MAG TPA: hypothetical protein VMM13_19605 [Euzebya sp.]|nr:hypothetical protein [Euzebya sp.]